MKQSNTFFLMSLLLSLQIITPVSAVTKANTDESNLSSEIKSSESFTQQSFNSTNDTLNKMTTDSSLTSAKETPKITSDDTVTGINGTASWIFENGILTFKEGNLTQKISEMTDIDPQAIEKINFAGKITIPSLWSETSFFFANLSNLVGIDNGSNLDFSNVSEPYYLFRNDSRLEYVDTSNWDTSNMIRTTGMFMDCKSLKTVNVSKWNMSKVVDLGNMFNNCILIDNLDVSNWDTSNVGNLDKTFFYNQHLSNIDVSSWDTSKVKIMVATFMGCVSLTKLDIYGWNVSNVVNANSMLKNLPNVEKLDVSKWNISNIVDMAGMFSGDTSLTELNLSIWENKLATNTDNILENTKKLKKLFLSPNFKPTKSNFSIPAVPKNAMYTGNWQNIGNGTAEKPLGEFVLDSKTLSQGSPSKNIEIFVWQPVTLEGSDFTMYLGDPTPTISNFKAYATDKNGNSSEINIDFSKVDFTKIGVYDVTLSTSDGQSKVVKLTIKSNEQSISGSNYTMYIGDNTPTVADFKASATDKSGAASEVIVDLSKADLKKVGNYDVTLKSSDGQTKTVKLTVKANKQSITGSDYSMYVGDNTPTEADFKASATDKDGKYSAVTIDLSKANLNKVGTYNVTITSADGQTKVVKLMMKAKAIDTVKVTFNSGEGGTLQGKTTMEVPKGTKVTELPKTIANKSNIEDIYFLDWYQNGKTVNPEAIMINGDTTFTAKFGAAVYRLYNKNNGDHLLTKNKNEKNEVATKGWKIETNPKKEYGRAAFYVPVQADSVGKKQVYRIYNPNSGEHFYTTNKSEADAAARKGWRHETNSKYTWVSEGDVKVYREFNPDVHTAGSHNFTTDLNEHRRVVSAGWKDESKATSLWTVLKAGF